MIPKIEKYSSRKIKTLQEAKLRDLLLYLQEHSVFYKNYFRQHGFNPAITSLDGLKQLPPVSKEELILGNKDVHTNLKFNKRFFCETSGSSGQVLTFWRNEKWDSANRAAILRGYSWYDVAPWESNIYFWGYNIDSSKQLQTRMLDLIQNRYRVFDYSPETLAKLFRKLKGATYMHGYASVIYELAKLVKEQKIEFQLPGLKMIKGTSERIYPHYQDMVTEAFGQKMISEYGAAEASIVAFECVEGKMHTTMENVLVEVEEGEVIITNLVADSFPIIRYRLGDYVKLAESGTCSCGMEHPIIEEVRGRVGKNIYGVRAGAQFYFDKHPRDLTAKEGAFLAMLLPSPIKYSASYRQGRLSKYAQKTIDNILVKLRQARIITEEERLIEKSSYLSFEDERIMENFFNF